MHNQHYLTTLLAAVSFGLSTYTGIQFVQLNDSKFTIQLNDSKFTIQLNDSKFEIRYFESCL